VTHQIPIVQMLDLFTGCDSCGTTEEQTQFLELRSFCGKFCECCADEMRADVL